MILPFLYHGHSVNRMTVEKMNVLNVINSKMYGLLSQKYWYLYRQYFFAKVLLLVLTIVFRSIDNTCLELACGDGHRYRVTQYSVCHTALDLRPPAHPASLWRRHFSLPAAGYLTSSLLMSIIFIIHCGVGTRDPVPSLICGADYSQGHRDIPVQKMVDRSSFSTIASRFQ